MNVNLAHAHIADPSVTRWHHSPVHKTAGDLEIPDKWYVSLGDIVLSFASPAAVAVFAEQLATVAAEATRKADAA